ncbi:cob(I)yrinic acid a,c-diamide adenosyltransferase [Candidatus Peregrinibacteria bacterium]|nr:cob(I)yrinic acid a,c-diamide adenosyltransferase [Candidatus Peregrinibacteria bacterium]
MILVITGNGKGKTTSALGTALRASGWEKKVAITFFDKGGSHYGEENTLKLLQEKIHILRFGCERFDEKSKTFRFENSCDDKKQAEEALEATRKLFDKDYFLIICDELINCMNLGLLEEDAVRKLVNDCPASTHLMLTGRHCPDWLRQEADLVSEVQDTKHYYRDGKDAIKGLDY